MNKLVLVLAIQVGVVFALASSCSISHKSGDFACTKTSDCDTGRDCVDGFCVVSGTEQIDSPTGTDGHGSGSGSGSNACPAQCTSCSVSQKTCVIDCQGGADCSGTVACPPGYSCDVKCDTDNSCRSGVVCAGTTKCTVECTGKNSCQNVQCGTSACDVECSGVQSCKTVACGASCACDVKCTGTQSCGDTVTCTSAACHIALGCSSLPTTCHSCM